MSDRKDIILVGGARTRLHPATLVIPKEFISLYDKPATYFPLPIPTLTGIRNILVISTPRDSPIFLALLEQLRQTDLTFSFADQPEPGGIAQAFMIAEEFLDDDSFSLILGGNIFYGNGLSIKLQVTNAQKKGSCIIGYDVNDPKHYGVVTLNKGHNPIAIIEKTVNPSSRMALTGLCFYDEAVVDIEKKLTFSARDELEITAVNKAYRERENLTVQTLGRGNAWFETSTHDSPLDATKFAKRFGVEIPNWRPLLDDVFKDRTPRVQP